MCARTGAVLQRLGGHDGSPLSLAWSADGLVIYTGTDSGSLRSWCVATGAPRSTFEGHSGCVRSLALSPRGSTLFSASYDTTLRGWDAATGECTAIMRGHTFHARSVVPAQGGAVYSNGSDDDVRLWRPRTGLGPRKGDPDAVTCGASLAVALDALGVQKSAMSAYSAFEESAADAVSWVLGEETPQGPGGVSGIAAAADWALETLGWDEFASTRRARGLSGAGNGGGTLETWGLAPIASRR